MTAECCRQVGGEGADIGSLPAHHPELDLGIRAGSEGEDLQLMDLDRPRVSLHDLTSPRQLVEAAALVFEG